MISKTAVLYGLLLQCASSVRFIGKMDSCVDCMDCYFSVLAQCASLVKCIAACIVWIATSVCQLSVLYW